MAERPFLTLQLNVQTPRFSRSWSMPPTTSAVLSWTPRWPSPWRCWERSAAASAAGCWRGYMPCGSTTKIEHGSYVERVEPPLFCCCFFWCSWSFWPTKLSLVYSWYKKSGATSAVEPHFSSALRKQCCLNRRWGPGAKWWATGSSNSWVPSWPPRSTRSSVAWRWRRSGSWERLEVKHLRDRWWSRDIRMFATCGFGAFVNSPSWQSPTSTCLFWVNLGSLEFLG